MRAIGPYVVRRELPERTGAGPGMEGAPVLWATDRLTGMPALLHPVEGTAPLPPLPAHPMLLPLTDEPLSDEVEEGAHRYLVTELPLSAGPETDPERAARGALTALAFLHERGLTHGALGAEQFWRVGEEFRLTGAGLPRSGPPATPADDLRDLARALSDLGPLPAPLRALGENLAALSAQDLLGRLVGEPAGESVEDADGGGPPARPVDAAPEPAPGLRPPAPFDLILTPPLPNETPPADEPGDKPTDPEPTEKAPADQPSPVPPARPHAASRASERLRADSRRMLDHSAERRDQVAAQVAAEENSEGSEGEPAPATPQTETSQAETPQERRRRELRARQQEKALREQLAALRRANPEPTGQNAPTDAQPEQRPEAGDIAEFRRRRRGEEPTSPPPPAQKRQLGPVRIGWNSQGERQLIRAVNPRTQLLRWLLPVLGALVLAFTVSLLVREMRPAPPAVAAAGECCAVQLQLAGVGAGERAALTVVRPPQGVTLERGAALGELPGEVRFPAPGLYRVQVSTLPPAAPRTRTLDLRVPNPERLTVNLGE